MDTPLCPRERIPRRPTPARAVAWAVCALLLLPARTPLAMPTERDARLHQGLSWDYCGPRPASAGPLAIPPEPSPDTPINIDAGGLTYDPATEIVQLVDGVRVTRGTRQIASGTILWDRARGEFTAPGEAELQDSGLRVLGERLHVRLDGQSGSQSGSLADLRYRFSETLNARGSAELLRIRSPRDLGFERLRYTTCPPGQPAWELSARHLDVDRVRQRAVARGATLRIAGVPVLYTPYLDFPIDNRRHSGFLVPTFGTSDRTGLDLTIPYYFNIAPHLDATFAPRYMSKRGLMLGGELRYLSPWDRGELGLELVPDDREYREDNGMRWAVRFRQAGQLGARWQSGIDYSLVSDVDYLGNFGNSLEIASLRHLEQRAELRYLARDWWLLARLEAFQTVDPEQAPAERPYGRLPQLSLSTRPFELGAGLHANLQAEYDAFDHRHRIRGERLALQPRLSLPLTRPYGHLIPSAGLLFTQYRLSGPGASAARVPSQWIPTAELDGKLVFERPLHWFGQAAVQTLEPRLYYLYTPYRGQNALPVFDSAELADSFTNLFRSNRFSGRDRIGDANQLTTALTARTLDRRTGDERLRVSLGQIHYFADRRVQIEAPPASSARSPLIGELAARLLGHWSMRANFQWDDAPDDQRGAWRKRDLALQYQHPQRQLLNLAYRFDAGGPFDTGYEDADLSFRWPLGARAEVVGRWLYSVLHERTMEAIAGIEFGQCCWRLRLVGHHFKNRPEAAGSNSVMLQLELAGLGGIGNSLDSFLGREIHGYHPY